MTTVAQAIGGLVIVSGLSFLVFTVSFRSKVRPVQNAIRRLNRDVTNPRQLRRAGQPGAWASVVRHVGRTSGTAYRTPVVALELNDSYVFALPYGPRVDWVRNVVASGSATLEHDGRCVRVDRPTLVQAADAGPLFERREQRMHRFFGVDDFLRVWEAESGRAAA